MEIMEWVRFIIGAVFLLIGMFVFLVEMIGVFKFHYVLNRMHAAAMGDTYRVAAYMKGFREYMAAEAPLGAQEAAWVILAATGGMWQKEGLLW